MMRRLTRLQKPASFTPACSSPSQSPATTSAATRCPRRRDFSCLTQRSRVSPSTTLSPRITSIARPFSSTAPALRKLGKYSKLGKSNKPDEWVSAHEVADLSDADPVELDEATAQLLEIETDLKLPGEFRRFPPSEQVTDPSYVPAQTADKLEWVGGLDDWWEDNQNWPASKNYVGFGPVKKITDPAVLELLTRRALVEALALQKGAGEHALAAPWQVGGRAQLVSTLRVGIEVSEHRAATLTEDAMDLVVHLTSKTTKQKAGDADLPIDPEEAREFTKAWDPSWKEISLDDPRLKFAIAKRLQQLTGHILSDSKLLRVRGVESLLEVLIKPAPPKKLAEVVEAKGALAELPNVKVYPRRVTPIDKEKMVGRWKVIVKELEKRELPITGTGGYEKSVERKWVDGKA